MHFIVNNQIGFTTYPRYSRSSPYPSDVAKMIEAPIFHVNGDDPEAVVYAAKVATEFRQKFQKPVVIDMFCYRRYRPQRGRRAVVHAAADVQGDPLASVDARDLRQEARRRRRASQRASVEKMRADWRAKLDVELEASQSYKANSADWLDGRWADIKFSSDAEDSAARQHRRCACDAARTSARRSRRCRKASTFTAPSSASSTIAARRSRPARASTGRPPRRSSFCSLLLDGHPVRLSGQDSERGTFSQRHSVLIDQETENRHIPFNSVRDGQARFEVINSMLSEEAVLGFEYGYSLVEPNALTLWEAQFGDFANGAQVIFDQFISSGERKWLRMSGLVCLLPHGYEGQGPEHSSARLERYLQMCAEDNMQVANCTTPANYFHILRRQLKRDIRKPLILMTPKSLSAPSARGLAARGAWAGYVLPSPVVGRRAAAAGGEDQARARQQDQAGRALLRQGLLRSLRGAREARHRRHLSAARRADLSGAAARAGA